MYSVVKVEFVKKFQSLVSSNEALLFVNKFLEITLYLRSNLPPLPSNVSVLDLLVLGDLRRLDEGPLVDHLAGEGLDGFEDLGEVPRRQQFLFHQMQQSKGDSENHLQPFQEEEIPYLVRDFLRHVEP